jgi:hypothetical protein
MLFGESLVKKLGSSVNLSLVEYPEMQVNFFKAMQYNDELLDWFIFALLKWRPSNTLSRRNFAIKFIEGKANAMRVPLQIH